jgi:hypothetical protein
MVSRPLANRAAEAPNGIDLSLGSYQIDLSPAVSVYRWERGLVRVLVVSDPMLSS